MASEAAVAPGACRAAGVCGRSGRAARLLACALLEWVLIALLLANGVFSYLIARFAAFFGLPPPCALCSRLAVDSLFDAPHRRGAGAEPLRRVLCDGHAAEVSRLGYCRAHRRLADAADMCEDCGAASGKALLSWMRRSELGERDLACACCGVALESGFYSPPFLLPTPSAAAHDPGRGCEQDGHGDVVFVSEDGPVIELFDEKPLVEDDSIGVISAHRAGIAGSVERLVSLESIDSLAVGVPELSSEPSGEGEGAVDHVAVEQNDVVPEKKVNADEEKFVAASDVQHSPHQMNNGLKEMSSEDKQVEQGTLEHELFSMPSDTMEHGFVVGKSDGNTEEVLVQQAEIKIECDAVPMEGGSHDSEASNENTEENQVQQAEPGQELDSVMIHPREYVDEECEEEKIELKQELDSAALDSWEQVTEISNENIENHVEQPELNHLSTFMAAGKDDIEVDPTEDLLPSLHQLSDGHSISSDKSSPDCSDVEDKRVSDKPTHIEDISYLQELPDPKAVTADTRSVDSSVANIFTDLESVELVSVDQLKSALGAAHKSLSTLYAELENERSAAAIAADETMAMINRLQEQKAAMQMEAMQYQRLMEEQSEYDQEALQRLNDLVVKRDKERQDMERELELYRHKIHLYEAKERRKMSRHKADDPNGSSSASSSAEDSDDLSQSFYEGDESAHGLNGSNGSSPTDVVLHETASHIVTLDGSLADCEEERLSILEQLKVLEERLFDLEDEESDNLKMDKHFTEDNHSNGASNGFSDEDISFKLHDSRKGVSNGGKKLLPLFDDATMRNGNGLLTKQGTVADPSAEVVLELAKEQDKLAIASEIDQVHERLQALEADKEFIKQCLRSLNKGGKGFVLLQEILQHLRDLRRIEQRARNNSGEVSPHYVHPYTD
ncbi:myosin-binding protein 2-like [Triticum dicoccoides]|uniref:myosin-binding protein 2-like n=1 Tax=Triticum dicoccoides TaxID=85692 RepID=UPI00188DD345|nr:myosin-binding protein 2-like [Triticum dicoccoides]XP_037428964.1 myosin-binding protein 2-like [Triticum dicoccoides]